MTTPHWDYFLALDRDLDRLSRYIQFAEENLGVYSVELTKLLLSLGSEVEVVAKQLTFRHAPESKLRNIDDYRAVIPSQFPNFRTFPVSVPRLGRSIVPWESWPDKNPQWWRSYNDVKHHRHDKFRDASLGNVLHASCGLFALLFYYYQEDIYSGRIVPEMRSLAVDREVGGSLRWGFDYYAPDFQKNGGEKQ
jgi:hypothetical protein